MGYRISVAMATYNGEKFLLPQLCSLLNQTRQPDEVIICDDQSTDATVEIVRKFVAENHLLNWKILVNESNLGYIRNFRRAMSAVTGDVIFLCDQDDVWCAEKIAIMSEILEQDVRIETLVCGYRMIDAEGKSLEPQPKKFYTPPKGTGRLSLVRSGQVLYGNIAQGCAGAYRRSIVDDYCAGENCNVIAHDWALNMLAYERQGLYFLNQELICYRLHSGNATGIVKNGRVCVIEKDIRCLEDGMRLRISPSSRAEIQRIIDFYRLRIKWLQTARLAVWMEGCIRFFPLIARCFWKQYLKDFVLTLRGKQLGDTI